MRTLLIDSDILAVRVAAVSEKRIKWNSEDWHDDEEEQLSVSPDDFEMVEHRVNRWLSELKQKLDADSMIICLSDKTRRYFRHDIYPAYKSNRTSGYTPHHLSATKDLLRGFDRVYERPGLEADDVMGILATHPTLVSGEKIIVSDDKDMGTVPCWWYRPMSDSLQLVTRDKANYTHMHQTITGDTVDGYPGRPGAGPKTADEALEGLDDPRDRWEAVLSVYSTKVRGKLPSETPEQDALVQARVAKILTYQDYDFKRRRPILWTPPAA